MLCYYCMKESVGAERCGFCGHLNSEITAERHQLKPGTVLNRKYVVGRVLGEGGFGITYIGMDTTLKIRVAIKEYFPRGYSIRDNESSSAVIIGAGENETFFQDGLRRFLYEARNLASFSNEPGIVNVRDFFEENKTAYIVMDYLEGVDLRHYVKEHGILLPEEACTMLLPVMKSLEAVHRTGVIHRDISPDNIMCLKDGRMKLMDFGAARVYDNDNRSLSVMLKKGYAPEEQYHRNGEQGPWTDVYSLCATIYRCITGKVPEESLDRVFNDTLARPSQLGVPISSALEDVLMYGLAVNKNDRCQSMTELMRLIDQALHGGDVYPVIPVPTVSAGGRSRYPRGMEDGVTYGDRYDAMTTGYRSTIPTDSGSYEQGPEPPAPKKKTGAVVAAVVLIAVLAGVVGFLVYRMLSDDSGASSGDKDSSVSETIENGTQPTETSAEPSETAETVAPTETEPIPTETEPVKPTETTAVNPYHADGFVIEDSGYPAYYENGKKISHLGVDISEYQTGVDFQKLKNAGVEFVFIRVGGRFYGSGELYSDEKFETYYSQARSAGLKVGAFFNSQAISAEEAREEASFVLSRISGKQIDYPVAFDWENILDDDARTDDVTTDQLTVISKAFCDSVNSAGYRSVIYYCPEQMKIMYDFSALRHYSFWLADYGAQPDVSLAFDIWQQSKSGSVPGIEGEVDIDLSLIDY